MSIFLRKKNGIRDSDEKLCGIRDSREKKKKKKKRAGMRDHNPLFQTLLKVFQRGERKQHKHMYSFFLVPCC